MVFWWWWWWWGLLDGQFSQHSSELVIQEQQVRLWTVHQSQLVHCSCHSYFLTKCRESHSYIDVWLAELKEGAHAPVGSVKSLPLPS